MSIRFELRAASALMTLGAVAATPAVAQTFGVDFAADYAFTDLGNPTGIPSALGGVTFKPGDLNTLLIGGAANSASGAIYEIAVTRDANGHISSFNGAPTLFSTATNIDGGLDYGPGGVLFFTGYSNNILGQIEPGSVAPDRIIDLAPLGVTGSVGVCAFVPPGFPGEGTFKIGSYSTNTWYEADLVADGNGTYDVTNVTLRASLGGGLEGMAYVPAGNPGFAVDSVLVCEWAAGRVAVYDTDAAGDPIAATRRDFLEQLSGAEGAVIDPLTGDFIFSTFGGGDRVLVVRGFDVPTTYCQAKANSLGCEADIGFSGTPTLSGADDFAIQATDVFNQKFGIHLFGFASANTPFAGGTICIATPFKRYPVKNSAGSAVGTLDCTGVLSYPLPHAFMQANGMTAGTPVYVQFLMRDPGFAEPNNFALSNALRFVVQN